jgi:hypothetical protein
VRTAGSARGEEDGLNILLIPQTQEVPRDLAVRGAGDGVGAADEFDLVSVLDDAGAVHGWFQAGGVDGDIAAGAGGLILAEEEERRRAV